MVERCVLERDNYRCATTGREDDDLKVVRIFELTSERCPSRPIADLEALSALWPEAMARTRLETVRNKGVTESANNFLTIHPDLYSHWKAGQFDLRPLPSSSPEEEGKANRIRLEFYWLSQSYKVTVKDVIWKGLVKYSMNITEWRPKDHCVRTGDVFTIRSANPRLLPLRTLLELQWDFARMAKVTGAKWDDEY